jgi:hypothetical protein
MTPDYAEIQRLLDAMHAACGVNNVARTAATRLAVRAARDDLIAARAQMRDNFAAEHGWIYSTRGFTIDQLRRGSTQARRGDCGFQVSPMDHVEYFRLAERPWRPVAILSHEYGSFETSLAFALERGVTATLLPESWYSPGRANAVLYSGYYSPCQ